MTNYKGHQCFLTHTAEIYGGIATLSLKMQMPESYRSEELRTLRLEHWSFNCTKQSKKFLHH